MTQLSLVLDRVNPKDSERNNKLSGDLLKVFNIILDRKPHFVKDIAAKLCLPENSVQAHLRHLRKNKFGRHNVVRRSVTKGTSYYILEFGSYQK